MNLPIDVYLKEGLLVLDWMTLDDLPELILMLADEKVTEQVFFGPNSPELTQEYFTPLLSSMEKNLNQQRIPEVVLWSALFDGEWAGNGALVPMAYSAGNYDLGYQLLPPFWGKGIGFAIASHLKRYALEVLHARKLSATCLYTNHGSKRILEKIGMVLEGIQKDHFVKNGKAVDQCLYGLIFR